MHRVLGGGVMAEKEAIRVVEILDVTNKDCGGVGDIAYKDFRRYVTHVDGKLCV